MPQELIGLQHNLYIPMEVSRSKQINNTFFLKTEQINSIYDHFCDLILLLKLNLLHL